MLCITMAVKVNHAELQDVISYICRRLDNLESKRVRRSR
jgi:hypothetical protein